MMISPPSSADYIRVLPEIVLSIWGMIIMFVEPMLPEGRSRKGLGIFGAFGVPVSYTHLAVLIKATTGEGAPS